MYLLKKSNYYVSSLILTFFIILQFCTFSFGNDTFWFRDGELETWFIERLNPCVVFIINKSNKKSITGILLEHRGSLSVLTNYHFMNKNIDEIEVYLTKKKGKLDVFKCKLIKHDSKLDLALFKILFKGETLEKLVSGGFLDIDTLKIKIPKENKIIGKDAFGNFLNIKRGKNILFLGFPLRKGITYEKSIQNIEVTKENKISLTYIKPIFKNAIARYGKIASKINENGTFLIDAMVSHGNSGSPVFVRSGYVKNHEKVYMEYKFIGILKAFIQDEIQFRSDNGQLISIPHNTGLGEVISVVAIENFIKDLKDK
jgi:hypothetical protein